MPIGLQKTDTLQIREWSRLLVDGDGVGITLAECEIGRGVTLHVMNIRR